MISEGEAVLPFKILASELGISEVSQGQACSAVMSDSLVGG